MSFYPSPEIKITNMTIKPGDHVTAGVSYDDDGNQFIIDIGDNDTGQSYESFVRFSGAKRSSAEFIAEAPKASGTTLPLANVVREAVAEFREEALASGYQVQMDLDSCAATIRADEEALRRAVRNLLENAVKFAGVPHGVGGGPRESSPCSDFGAGSRHGHRPAGAAPDFPSAMFSIFSNFMMHLPECDSRPLRQPFP